MSLDLVRAAVTRQLQVKFQPKQPSVMLAYENQKFTQPSGPWVYVSCLETLSRKAALGKKDTNTNQTYFRIGVITCQIMVPEDTGTSKSNAIADALQSVLADNNWSLPEGGYLTTYGTRTVHRGVTNGYYTVNLLCEFRQQFVSAG